MVGAASLDATKLYHILAIRGTFWTALWPVWEIVGDTAGAVAQAAQAAVTEQGLLGLRECGSRRPLNRTYRSESQHRANSQRQGETLLVNALRRQRLSRADLARLSGADSSKVPIAVELWQTTTASQAWIADQLHMKSAANVSQILRRNKSADVLSEYVD